MQPLAQSRVSFKLGGVAQGLSWQWWSGVIPRDGEDVHLGQEEETLWRALEAVVWCQGNGAMRFLGEGLYEQSAKSQSLHYSGTGPTSNRGKQRTPCPALQNQCCSRLAATVAAGETTRRSFMMGEQG